MNAWKKGAERRCGRDMAIWVHLHFRDAIGASASAANAYLPHACHFLISPALMDWLRGALLKQRLRPHTKALSAQATTHKKPLLYVRGKYIMHNSVIKTGLFLSAAKCWLGKLKSFT